MEEKEKEELAELDNIEISPLTDEDLESVAGGADGCTGCDHDSNCSGFDAV